MKNVNAGMAGWNKLEPIAVLYVQKHVLSSKFKVYVFLKYHHCRFSTHAKIKKLQIGNDFRINVI